MMWTGSEANSLDIEPDSKKGVVSQYDSKVDNYPELKVHQPLEIKNKRQNNSLQLLIYRVFLVLCSYYVIIYAPIRVQHQSDS